VTSIAIVGGGPAGYEAALVAAQLGAEVTLIEPDGLGGACVLYDCVPSKTLIATSETMSTFRGAPALGVRAPGGLEGEVSVEAAVVNRRVKDLAAWQSEDVWQRLSTEGVRMLTGRGRFAADQPGRARRVEVVDPTGRVTETLDADVVLLATGATPRVLPGAAPDGDRILTWRQVYDLTELPDHLVVVGSGVTGAEFASAYLEMGVRVTLVSSRVRVLPGEDTDAADVIEEVFAEHGGEIVKRARAASVVRTEKGVLVTMEDGRTVEGSHALMTVGSVPNTEGLALGAVGVTLDERGFVEVDRVSRTAAAGVYAAGDCTGVLMLASVAAMQGRIAMWHALGEAVHPIRLSHVAATIFTEPEIATVGLTQAAAEEAGARVVKLPLATNARAKMQGFRDGFIKLFARPSTGMVLGGVVVAPRASELILGVSLAVEQHLTVDQVAHTFAVYPSLTGSLTEAARKLMRPTDDI